VVRAVLKLGKEVVGGDVVRPEGSGWKWPGRGHVHVKSKETEWRDHEAPMWPETPGLWVKQLPTVPSDTLDMHTDVANKYVLTVIYAPFQPEAHIHELKLT